MTTLLANLRAARNLLDLTYVKWITDDGKGGHCAVGALGRISTIHNYQGYMEMLVKMNNTARELHPELWGAEAPREQGESIDKFDAYPLVYVNNQLGKEATLAVFDAAILDLEIAEAKDKVEVKDRELVTA